MIKNMKNKFKPDYAIHPGEILAETLIARNISKGNFSKRCGIASKTLNLILNRKAPVTPETAIQFEKVLGVSAEIWNNLDYNYKLFILKKSLFD